MSPEDITLREISQAQKGRSCQLSEAQVKSTGVKGWEDNSVWDGQRGNGELDVSGVNVEGEEFGSLVVADGNTNVCCLT